jgi:hypothetical protein
METQVNPSVISVVLIAMAAASLVIMLSLNQINYLVHGALYDFGLTFSYRWAMPYWVFSGILFGLSWANIFIAIIITVHVVRKSRKQIAAVDQTYVMGVEPALALAEDTAQREILEFCVAEQAVEPLEEGLEGPSEGLIEPIVPPPVAVENADPRPRQGESEE